VTAEDKLYDFRPRTANLDKLKQHVSTSAESEDGISKHTLDLYKSFMRSYVKRINDATFKVTIGGIRIGAAKYTRLAQINLKSKVITFSRFAIENVPERGRRYLVLHELAHVLEASHNQYFWNLVGKFEPDYKEIGTDLDRAFKKNVKSHDRSGKRSANTSQGPEANSDLFRAHKLLWTPDHGYIEHGSKHLGLHKDPVENFVRGVDNHLAEEAFRAYIDLKREQYESDGCEDINASTNNPNLLATATDEVEEVEDCSFNSIQTASHDYLDLYDSDDQNYTDNYFGTMSGGDCLL